MSNARRFEPTNVEPFVQLPVQCACGKREARRVAKSRLDKYKNEDPEHVLETVQCTCGRTYGIKAKAYQEALRREAGAA